MAHKKYFSYVRVSTQRQGELNTSLTEQKAAIDRYAKQWGLLIVECFEERETAAKQGRPVFVDMLKALRAGKVNGVIIHKIDRSARNLKDWADLGNLIDAGVEVHFANESLDLNSRGGRLSADIQAVVASDYIRNLREETRKGIYGRLKQGLYPFPAPIGYINAGAGEAKRPDPVQAPFIRKTFEHYATGKTGLIALADRIFELGLRNKSGNRVSINGLSTILHNSFYVGLIRIEKTGEMFPGKHRPLVSRTLFDRVQDVFAGRFIKKTERHFFVFRRHIDCLNCKKLLIAEKQKCYVYYRCHTRNCRTGPFKEEIIEKEFKLTLERLNLSELEYTYFRQETFKQGIKSVLGVETKQRQMKLRLEQIKARSSKLADAYVEGVFEKDTYIEKKNELIVDEQSTREKLSKLSLNYDEASKRLEVFLELLNSASLSYKYAKPEEKRDLVKMTTSNFTTEGKSVSIKLRYPFQLMADRQSFTSGSPYREATRTFDPLIKKLLHYFQNLDTSKGDNALLNYLTSKTPSKTKKNNYYNLQKSRANGIQL